MVKISRFIMALQRALKSRRCLLVLLRPINPNALLSVLSTRTIAPTAWRLLSSKVLADSDISFDDPNVANSLITIFIKQPFSYDNPELKNLAPKLSTKVVESVLHGFKSWRVAHMFFTWASNQQGYKHNCYTFNVMASIFSRARQNVPLKAMVLDILNSHCSMTPGALGFFMRCLGSVGLIEEANFLFDQVRIKGLCYPNGYSYTCLLEVLSKSNLIDLVEKRLREMRDYGWEFNKYTLTPLLQVYCNLGEHEKAMNVFNEMYERGWVDAHVFSILILAFSKWGKVDKAFDMIEKMEDHNLQLNEKTFHVLIHGFVKESRVDKALHLFDKMRKLGISIDVSLYDVLIGGLCMKKEVDKALSLYSEMKELGIQPDIRLLAKLIPSCLDEEEMIRLLEERSEEMDNDTMVLLYNAVLNGLINRGSFDQAYQMLRTATVHESSAIFEVDNSPKVKKKIQLDTTCFEVVINGLLKNARLDVALTIYEEMKQCACKPNLLIFNNLIDGLCNSNRLGESLKLLHEMEESGFRPTQFTHNSIYECLCRREDTAGALDLVKKMRINGHEPYIKNSTLLVKQLCKQGKTREACEFLSNMVQEGFLIDIVAYSAALNGLVKIQEVDQAMLMFRDICALGYRPDVVAYNVLINGLCKAKRVWEAHELLHEMVAVGLVPSTVSYNMLIDGWCKIDKIDQAMNCFSRISSEGMEPNVITYTTLIDGLCNAGRPDDALRLWNDMKSSGLAPNRITFIALITGLCKSGRPDAAIVHLRKMEEMGMNPEVFVYVVLISAFVSHSSFPSALEILRELVDKGNIPEPPDKNYLIVRDAIFKLLEDEKTSSSVKSLIEKGVFPTLDLSDTEVKENP